MEEADGLKELLRKGRVLIRNTVKDGLISLLGDEEEHSLFLLDASTIEAEGKFSLHIHTSLILREFGVDGLVLGRALNAAINLQLFFSTRENPRNENHLIGLLFMWNWGNPPTTYKTLTTEGLVDVCVYRKNQLFRMYANAKMGSGRYLRSVDDDGNVKDLPGNTKDLVANYVERYEIVPSLSEIEGWEYMSPVFVQPCEGLFVGPTGARLLCERDALLGAGGYEGSEAVHIPFWDRRNELFALHGQPTVATGRGKRLVGRRRLIFDGRWGAANLTDFRDSGRPNLQGSGEKGHNIVTSSYVFYDEMGRDIRVLDIVENGITVHCPFCDCGVERTERALLTEMGSPDFNPSSKSWRPPGGQMGVHCFSCCTFFLVCRLNEYDGFREGAIELATTEEGYIEPTIFSNLYSEWESRMGGVGESRSGEPSLKRIRRKGGTEKLLVAVNAPMGSGKTEAATVLSKHMSIESVLIVTYRRTLSRQLSSRFGAENYMDHQSNLDGIKRLVICVNSMLRISGDVGFDVVIQDEGDFITRHFVGGTFHRSTTMRRHDAELSTGFDAVSCLRRLSTILMKSKMVLVMQEGLDDDDVCFYGDLLVAGTTPRCPRPVVILKK